MFAQQPCPAEAHRACLALGLVTALARLLGSLDSPDLDRVTIDILHSSFRTIIVDKIFRLAARQTLEMR